MKKPVLFLLLPLLSLSLHAQSLITASASFSQSDADGYTWPITIAGGTISDPIVVTLAENISLSQSTQYFIIQSDYVTFNGNNFTVTIDNVSDYPGLVQDGDNGNNGYSFITISNTRIHSNNSTLLFEGGWIGQTYFAYNATNVIISNSSSDGDIIDFGGGITGTYSSCTVMNSHSSGAIVFASGGIFGSYSTGDAIKCYSVGNGGNYCGGILAYDCAGTASDCYSTGNIGFYGGGILGYNSQGSAIRCYSTGAISDNAGGITGAENYATIENCYSTGSIGTDAGGIAGMNNYASMTDCYTTGVIGAGGGICGTNDGGTTTNCFASNGTWSDADAMTYLTGANDSSWTDIDFVSDITPYKLAPFNAAIYSPASENIPSDAVINSSVGNFSTGTYSIVNINGGDPSLVSSVTIDAVSGMLTFTNSPLGTYITKVLYTDNSDASYQISNYTLNILSTLPLSWRSFTVTPKGNAAWLQWSTESEQNTRDFEVQYSLNGNSWTTINTVSAAGNSSAASNYSYLHADPVIGNNYYRIKQTDRDSKYSYSSIQNLRITAGSKGFSVLNTVVSNGVLQVEVKASTVINLFNNDGKLVWQREFNAGTQNIDVSAVPKGVYFLKSKDAVEKIVVR